MTNDRCVTQSAGLAVRPCLHVQTRGFTTQAIASKRCLPHSQTLQAALTHCHVSQSEFLQSLCTMYMPAEAELVSASTPIASASYSVWQLLWQLPLFSQQWALPMFALVAACACCSVCMLLHGVVCFVYGFSQLLCQPNANATQMLQLHQQSQETVLPLQRVKWLFKGHISLLPKPDKYCHSCCKHRPPACQCHGCLSCHCCPAAGWFYGRYCTIVSD